ncbi:MAG: hypothetical protein ACKN9K_14980, partial [Dolichospermum sp.]
MNCIFLCRIWKIENIQTVKTVLCSLFSVLCSLFPVPCSLFPVLTDNLFIQQALLTYLIANNSTS